MRFHYLIVHEHCIRQFKGVERADKVLNELQKIKENKEWSVSPEISSHPPENIPPNSPNLEI
jgi:hypothetical protein